MNRIFSLSVLFSIFTIAACGQSAEEPKSPGNADKATPSVQQADSAAPKTGTEKATAESGSAGEQAYLANCAACHQADGSGLGKAFPPLAGSDYLMEDKSRSISIILNGLQGPITVNGVEYNALMPPMNRLNDQTIANILTYVRSSWGNEGEPVTAAEVAALRAK